MRKAKSEVPRVTTVKITGIVIPDSHPNKGEYLAFFHGAGITPKIRTEDGKDISCFLSNNKNNISALRIYL